MRFFRTGARMVTLDEWSTTTRTEDDRDWVGFTFFKLVDLQEDEHSQRVEPQRASSTRQGVASLFPGGGLFDDPTGLMNQQNPERQLTNQERSEITREANRRIRQLTARVDALIVDNENYMTNHPRQDVGGVEEPVNPRITTCEVAEPVRPRITTYGVEEPVRPTITTYEVAKPVNPKITTSGESRGRWTMAGTSSSSGLHGQELQQDGMQRALVPPTRPYRTIDGQIDPQKRSMKHVAGESSRLSMSSNQRSTTAHGAVDTANIYSDDPSEESDGSFEKVET